MAFTEQQSALEKVKKLYGVTGYTEHTVHYRLVGFKKGSTKFFGIGDTWEQAFNALEAKVEK